MRNVIYTVLQPAAACYRMLTRKKIRILAYHNVPDPVIFEKQLKFLKKNFNVISIEEFIKALKTQDSIPDRSVVITFDDGDISVLDIGLPLLTRHGLPAVLFIITDIIGSKISFWWEKVEGNYKIKGQTRAEARKKVNELKRLTNKERLTYLSSLEEIPTRQMDLKALKKLNDGGVLIANHTGTHPMLDRCDPDEIRADLRSAKRFFRDLGMGYYHILAYPNGNIDANAESILKEEGIEYAFLFDHKLCTMPVSPMRISRIRVNADDPLPEFKVKISGLHSLINRAE